MRIFLTHITVLLAFQIHGQQLPQYAQYTFNNYLLNPAISGIENYIDVKAGNRSQWVGLEGAPVTNFLSLHAPLGKAFVNGNANSFSGSGNNPMDRSFVSAYRAAEPHHGIGFHVVTDETGPNSRYDIDATYAYHLGLTPTLNLAVGVAAGISNLSLNTSELVLTDVSDELPGTIDASKFKPDLGLGIWLYGPHFFAGVSGMQLLNYEFSSFNEMYTGKGSAQPHYFATAGYKIFLSDNIAAIPSELLTRVSSFPLFWDANLRLGFQDKFWVAGSYRKDDSFSAQLGLNISHLFNLGYAYDFTTSNLNTVSNGTHELVLGLLLNNRYKVSCPQRNW